MDDSTAARMARTRAEAEARVGAAPLESFIHDQSPEVVQAVASDSRLTEDLALSLLVRRDLTPQALEALSRNAAVTKSRKVVMALVAHPHTPRHVALPVVRHLYTFELMSLALLPALAADLKVAVEESIINRLKTISPGERLTLAKRGSTRVAAALLTDPEERVIEAALLNPYMTEACVVKALMAEATPQKLVDLVCRSRNWSVRREVCIALLRNDKTPLARAIAVAQSLPTTILRNVLHHSRLAPNVKAYLVGEVERRMRH